MKRTLVLVLLLALSVTVPSTADVLVEGWDFSALDELVPAYQKLSTQIDKLLIEHNRQFEPIELNGDDKGTLKDIVIPMAPARITIKGRVGATFKGNNYEKHIKHPESFDEHVDVLTQSGVYDVEVMHGYSNKQAWSITIEPLKNVGLVKQSGFGVYFSDLFTLPEDISVRFIATAKKMWNRKEPAELYLYYFDEEIDAWINILVSDGYVVNQQVPHRYEDTVKIDQIKQGTMCFWGIWAYPGLEWGIYPLK